MFLKDLIFSGVDEIGRLEEEDVIRGDYQNGHLALNFGSQRIECRKQSVESNLLAQVIDGFHQLSEVMIDYGQVLVVDFDLTFDVNSSIWSDAHQFWV